MAKPQGIVYLDRYSFDFYSELLGTVVRFPFAPELVRDYDIVDKDGFLVQLKLFIQQNNLQPVSLTIVVSGQAIFSKQLSIADPTKRAETVQAFLDSVPFELVGSITIPAGNVVQVWATSKDMYETIQQGFETNGFSVEGVVPAVMIKDANFTNGLSVDMARQILGMVESMRQFNFLTLPIPSQQETKNQQTGNPQEPKKNTRLFLMIGVFVVLLALLVITLFLTNRG